jgi:hypothetical protein
MERQGGDVQFFASQRKSHPARASKTQNLPGQAVLPFLFDARCRADGNPRNPLQEKIRVPQAQLAETVTTPTPATQKKETPKKK